MPYYAMFTKIYNINDYPVFKIKSKSLKTAKEHFRKTKGLSKEEFNKIFIVTEVKQ
tara:strand:- start:108 stop:275 length:168 start_codon:yes stop_codon:yes gene_type:complete